MTLTKEHLLRYLSQARRFLSPSRPHTPDPPNEDCSICFEPVNTFRLKTFREDDTKEFGIESPCCGKIFGTKCLFRWVVPIALDNEKCPNCRTAATSLRYIFFPKNYPESVYVSVPIKEISLDSSRVLTPEPSEGHLVTLQYVMTKPGAMGRFIFRKKSHQLVEKQASQWGKLYTTNGFLGPHVWSEYDPDDENPHKGIFRTYWQRGEEREVLTILEDDSQMWQISNEARDKGIITVKEPILGIPFNRERKVPAGTTHVMLSRDGKFLRWADLDQDWRRWVRWRAKNPEDASQIDPSPRPELNE